MPLDGHRDGQSVEVVRDRVRDAILTGVLPPGRRTSQVALVRDLGVGRTPLREALRMLQSEGLVVSEANRRVQVAELSGDDAEQLYAMRISLESIAVRTTVPMLATADLAGIEGLIAQMDLYMRHGDYAGFRWPHREFHHRLVAGAGERTATHIMQLFDHAERYRLAFGSTSSVLSYTRRAAEHRAIVEAAVDGDAELTADRLVMHYVSTARLIFAHLEPRHDLARLRTAIRAVAPGAERELDATLDPAPAGLAE